VPKNFILMILEIGSKFKVVVEFGGWGGKPSCSPVDMILG
jgi:hypothetical protein